MTQDLLDKLSSKVGSSGFKILRTLVETLPNEVYVKNTEGHYVLSNLSCARTLNIGSPEEIVGKSDFDFYPEEFARKCRADEREIIRSGHPLIDREYPTVNEEGGARWYSITKVPLRDETGEIVGLLGMMRDVTEQKEAQEALRRSEAKFRSVVHNSTEIVQIIDPDGTLRYASPAFKRVLGYDPDEAIGMNVLEYVHPDDLQIVEETTKALGENGVARNVAEFRFRHRDGSWRYIESVTTYLLEDPAVRGVVINSRDISERKRVEEKLHSLQREYEELVDSVDAIIWRGDAQPLKFTFVSHQAQDILGYPVERWTTEASFWRDHIHPADREWVLTFCQKAVEEKRSHSFEYRMLRKNGDAVWLRNVVHVTEEGGVPTELFGLMIDVTKRKQAEKKVRESEQRFRSLVQNASDLITILEEDGTIRYESPAIERMLGYRPEERIGKNAFDYLHPEEAERVKLTFAETLDNPGEVQPPVEFRLRHKNGSWRHMETTRTNLLEDPAVKGVVSNSRDVTERKLAEEKIRESEELYRAVVEQSAEAIWLFDQDTKQVLASNTAFQKMLGYTAEELLEMTNYDFVAHSREDIDSTVWAKVTEDKDPLRERQYRRADGTLLDVEVHGTLISYGGKEVVCTVARDLTERKETEKALRESEERFRKAFEDSPLGVALVALDGRRIKVNHALCEMLGYSEEELLGRYLDNIHPDDREISSDHLRRLLEKGCGSYTLERRYLHAAGHVVWNLTSVSLVQDSQGKPSHLVCLHQDITERKELEERLKHQAFYDSLTDLPNRLLFLDRLEHALARSERESGPIAVLLVDLDDFKVVNDSLGHDAGNAVLVQVAERLRGSVRPGDTVGRIFGDEFAILLEAPAGVEEAKRVMHRIEERLREPFEAEGQEIFSSASIGITLSETARDEPNEVLRHADLAMFEAKRQGKAKHEVYDPDMNVRAVERIELERDLRLAVEREEFKVYYQPKVRVESGEIVGVEALVRWQHPERGLLPPAEFLALAEETGLIEEIGLWVLKESCQQLKEWQEKLSPRPLDLCVNLSAREIHQRDLVEKVSRVLHETGLDPGCLILEISENTVSEEAEHTINKLRELKGLGVRLAIDDFGTGYCSLVYLEHSLLDFLKIDRMLIHKKKSNWDECVTIVSALTSLAHSLGLSVVVEGVESRDQLTELEAIGCEMAQGYYFARPLPAETVETLLLEGLPGDNT